MNNDDLDSKKKFEQEIEFFNKLRMNKLSIPNVFTKGMGKLIKKAREEKGMNQSQLAEKISRRQATVSDMENGKIEIGILTLVLLSIELDKPISFFIPNMMFSSSLSDIQNKLEEEALMLFRELTYIGDTSLAIDILKLLIDHAERTMDLNLEQ